MFAQRDAIVRLLRDDDPETVRLVKEQLALGGEECISGLRDLAQMDDQRVSRHARDVLAEIACQGGAITPPTGNPGTPMARPDPTSALGLLYVLKSLTLMGRSIASTRIRSP